MAKLRIWVYRILVVGVSGLIIRSFLLPWWTLNVAVDPDSGALPQIPDVVRIYAYGLRSDLTQMEDVVKPFITPHYQTVAAFIFLGVSIALILLSIWLKGRKGRLLLGFFGSVFIGYGLAFFLMLKKGLAGPEYPMQGRFYIKFSLITTTLKPAYFGIYIAGAALILLALLRDVIAPPPKS